MRIQNNIMAMNTHRMYTSNNNAVSRSAEKLSSGYRINRAGDDAAGLAISEKMRAQVRGLNMASKNSQDAISLVQTAEGALQEVHSMLQRMNELSVQSATGTNADFDRTQIAAEFEQLKGEIDQIAETTNFNNKKLLDGSLGHAGKVSSFTGDSAKAIATATKNIVDGTTETFNVDVSKIKIGDSFGGTAITDSTALSTDAEIATALAGASGLTASYSEGVLTLTNATGGDVDYEVDTDTNTNVSSIDLSEGSIVQGGGFSVTDGTNTFNFRFKIDGADISDLNATTDKEVAINSTDTRAAVATALRTAIDTAFTTDAALDGVIVNGTTINLNGTGITATNASKTTTNYGTGLQIQVGAEEGNTLNVSVDAMNSKALGLKDITIDTQANAGKAISATREAVNVVSDMRARLGAMQNRLDHKISNLDNTAENLQAAESRIRDVDIAKEMTTYTKNNILSQAATAMLAQANSAPQNVLSLLQ